MKSSILLALLFAVSGTAFAGNILRVPAPIEKSSFSTPPGEEVEQPTPEPEPEPEPVVRGFRVIGAAPGQNGIYQVESDGQQFPAYVDMTSNGGYWVLALYWKTPLASAPLMKELAVPNTPLVTWTADSSLYPVIPSGIANLATEGLILSTNPNWTSRFGAWQKLALQPIDRVVDANNPLPVETPAGVVNFWLPSNGFAQSATFNSGGFGLWTAPNNQGLCGGAGRVGTQKICPGYAGAGSANHADMTFDKFYFLKGR